MNAWRTALTEALEAIVRRPGRSSTTVLVVAVGVLTLIGTLGVAGNGVRLVQERFDAYESQTLRVEGWSPDEARDEVDGLTRLRAQPAIVAAGLVMAHPDGTVPMATHPLATPLPREVLLASPEALEALSGEVVLGRWWDEAMARRCDPVVVFGEAVASRAGVDATWLGRAVWVGGQRRILIGVVRSPSADPAVRTQVLVPYSAECDRPAGAAAPVVIARTTRGSATDVARVAPAA
ncbi:ABC transporter permease, partial [Kribbia dieselivorans]|uniref:ABC transporter permease n=1 Tax=Kribbia dieselivorans TaxID=331526 RepID=UPI0012ED4856